MILTYSKEQFKFRILKKIKIHTIREDKNNRWKPGRKIHHWLFNPRNISKHPHEFCQDTCKSTQKIAITRVSDYLEETIVHIDCRKLSQSEIQELAWNDGFENLIDFWLWFSNGFEGKIIHWTDKCY